MYQSPKKTSWEGRIDSGDGLSGLRWHQVIQLLDLSKQKNSPEREINKEISFLGFSSDEGVRRNQGRTGAVKGPVAIRKALSNLAVHFNPEEIILYDAGDVICAQSNLEAAQEQLAIKVQWLLQNKFFPVLFGGGHEIAYGHYKGIDAFLNGKRKAGIINFDAHFDLRPVDKEANSGTPFRQILEENNEFRGNFPYLCLGIQEASNTQTLFKIVKDNQVQFVLSEDINFRNHEKLKSEIDVFISSHDSIYLTIDLDVFAAPFAPGVSAPALNGIYPDIVFELIRHILISGKIISIDIAELNPSFDIDNRTAKLAAYIIYEIVRWKNKW